MYLEGEAETLVPNKWRWTPGRAATFTREERNGQAWKLTIEASGYVTQQQAAWLLGLHLTQVNALVRYQQMQSIQVGGVSMIALRVVTDAYRERRAKGLDTRASR
jgi:hypothetical protein